MPTRLPHTPGHAGREAQLDRDHLLAVDDRPDTPQNIQAGKIGRNDVFVAGQSSLLNALQFVSIVSAFVLIVSGYPYLALIPFSVALTLTFFMREKGGQTTVWFLNRGLSPFFPVRERPGGGRRTNYELCPVHK